MLNKRFLLVSATIVMASVWLGACGVWPGAPPVTIATPPPTAAPPDTPTPSPAPSAPSEEPAEWVFPENWWLKPQVIAQNPETLSDPDGNPVMNLDYDAYAKAGLTAINFFQGDMAAIQELHNHGIIVIAADSMLYTYKPALWPWSEFESPPELMDAAMRDPFGNIYRDDCGLQDLFGHDVSFVIYSMIHPLWQEHMLENMRAYIDAGVDGYLIDELSAGSAYEPDFNPYTVQLFADYLMETYNEEELKWGHPGG